MFRALLCSSLGHNFIILYYYCIIRCTRRPPTECDDTRCCI